MFGADPKSLEDLQALVGGWIEAAPTSNNVTFWINEEGKYNGMLPNPIATLCWISYDLYGCVANGDHLFGPLVIQGGRSRAGYPTDPPEEVWAWALNLTGMFQL